MFKRETYAGMQFQRNKRKSINPTRYIVLGFGAIILLGTLLLHLPISAQNGQTTPWLTCLFTATSATCVTGLILVDTAVHWSVFGQAVILLLLQLGGLGFVTLISIIPFALHRRIGLSQRLVMASAMNLDRVSGVVRVVRHALLGTLLVEGTGAVLLSIRFVPQFGLTGIWFSIFHSVSAFCNGGFDILGLYSGPYSSLAAYQGDPLVLCTIMALIVVGGLGFFVWEDLIQKRCWKKLTLYSKMVLGITACLIFFGGVYFTCAEWDNPATLGSMPLWQRPLNALFQSVTLRTAGYATFDQGGAAGRIGGHVYFAYAHRRLLRFYRRRPEDGDRGHLTAGSAGRPAGQGAGGLPGKTDSRAEGAGRHDLDADGGAFVLECVHAPVPDGASALCAGGL